MCTKMIGGIERVHVELFSKERKTEKMYLKIQANLSQFLIVMLKRNEESAKGIKGEVE